MMSNTEEVRKVEILNTLTNEWEVKKLKEVRRGNSFRMFESDGSPVISKGISVFVAIKDAYFEEELWQVSIEPLEEAE